MSVLSVRNVPEEVLAAAKKAAIDEGVSLREWVLGRITVSRRGTVIPADEPKKIPIIPKKSDEEIIREAQARLEERKKFVVPIEAGESKAERDRRIIEEAQRKLEERRKEVIPIAPKLEKAGEHDPRECRLYGCLMCKAAGHHDPIRGI